MEYGHWDVSLVGNFDPKDFYGFIYEIIEIETGKSYIGRKQINPKTKKSNNWKTYTSSSKELVSLIETKGKENFKFKILILCCGKSQLTYEEEKYQFENDVLRVKFSNGEKKYFNKTIGYRRFNGVEKQSEEAKEKIRLSNLGKNRTEEMKLKYSKSKKGILKSDQHKEKIRLANLGKLYSSETNSKKSKGPNGEKLNWWTDGTKQIRSINPPDDTWYKGRCNSNNEKYVLSDEHKLWILNDKPRIKDIMNVCNIPKSIAIYKKKSILHK